MVCKLLECQEVGCIDRSRNNGFQQIEDVLENYLQPRNEAFYSWSEFKTKLEAINQRNTESSGDFLTCLKHAAWYFEINTDPGAFMIRLRFFAGLQTSKHKLKAMEHFIKNWTVHLFCFWTFVGYSSA